PRGDRPLPVAENERRPARRRAAPRPRRRGPGRRRPRYRLGVPDRRRRLLILGICSMSLLIVGLDATIVNGALPAIPRPLNSSPAGLQWIVDAYTLALASLLMLAGSTADRLGRRRVFQAGLALFSLGSLLCAVAPSLGLLVGFRVLQAIG